MGSVAEHGTLDLTDDLDDVRVLAAGRVSVIEINRPHRLNAFTSDTVDHLITAFRQVRHSRGLVRLF